MCVAKGLRQIGHYNVIKLWRYERLSHLDTRGSTVLSTTLQSFTANIYGGTSYFKTSNFKTSSVSLPVSFIIEKNIFDICLHNKLVKKNYKIYVK